MEFVIGKTGGSSVRFYKAMVQVWGPDTWPAIFMTVTFKVRTLLAIHALWWRGGSTMWFSFTGQLPPSVQASTNPGVPDVPWRLIMMCLLRFNIRSCLYIIIITLSLPNTTIVYHGISQQDAYCLQKLQRTACRAILRADMHAHIDDMHNDLKVSTLYQRRCQHIVTQVFKFLHDIGPPSCCNLLKYVSSMHTVMTRSAENMTLHVPTTRLNVTDNDFTIVGPLMWNQLPHHIKSIGSIEDFKLEITKSIFA